MTEEDVLAWRDRATAEATSTLELLAERLTQLPAATQEEGRMLLARASDVSRSIEACGSQGFQGVKTRFHGDYHLGQVLVSRNDFIIIDFEGEPARSFEERRALGSPLRDVAGMVRSFNYARWTALRHIAQSTDELAKLEPLARIWEAETREAFLKAYMERAAMDGIAQRLDSNCGLFALFEIEKAMYELRYELNNRTDWVQVPLQGILALIDKA
jgi:maltose alpha-D-glucosyltransferase/alpha-amylase